MTDKTALQEFEKCEGNTEQDPIERLRFFCSLAMRANTKDWLDVEAFFDDVIAERDSLRAELQSARDAIALITNLIVFLAETWTEIDKFVYEQMPESIDKYPVIQGTGNQIALNKLGSLPYDKTNLRKAIDLLLQNPQHSEGG